MEKLAQAKVFKHKAETFVSEGNYEYAIRSYEKIISLLKQAICQSKSEEIISQIKTKIHQFELLISQAQKMKIQKEEKKSKLQSGFGFPKTPSQQPKKQEIKRQDFIPQVKQEKGMDIQSNAQVPQIPKPKVLVNNPAKVVNGPFKKNMPHNVPIDHKKPIMKPPVIKKQPIVPQKKQEVPIKKPHQSLDKKKPGVKPVKIAIDPDVQELIVRKNDVSFKDIVGLTEAKTMLEQAVIRPRKRPDLYTGIRAPPRALLLYGPPGNGKTYLCKALANESGCTFIALSASSILNKYVGQSQKTIKKIFAAAEKLAPSIIFIDQIDSMLTARTQNENDAARRLKTEFLVLMDGINSPKSGQILVIGATNLPKQLDNAAKRRFSKFIYIGNPQDEARRQLVLKNLHGIQYDISEWDLNKIVQKLQYFSASEIRNIVAEVCMLPLREVKQSKLEKISMQELRNVNIKDFMCVIEDRKPIVSKEDLAKYKQKI